MYCNRDYLRGILNFFGFRRTGQSENQGPDLDLSMPYISSRNGQDQAILRSSRPRSESGSIKMLQRQLQEDSPDLKKPSAKASKHGTEYRAHSIQHLVSPIVSMDLGAENQEERKQNALGLLDQGLDNADPNIQVQEEAHQRNPMARHYLNQHRPLPNQGSVSNQERQNVELSAHHEEVKRDLNRQARDNERPRKTRVPSLNAQLSFVHDSLELLPSKAQVPQRGQRSFAYQAQLQQNSSHMDNSEERKESNRVLNSNNLSFESEECEWKLEQAQRAEVPRPQIRDSQVSGIYQRSSPEPVKNIYGTLFEMRQTAKTVKGRLAFTKD